MIIHGWIFLVGMALMTVGIGMIFGFAPAIIGLGACLMLLTIITTP